VQGKKSVRLTLPADLGPECLREQWRLEVHPQESKVVTFWDSFEWGVWFGGHVLYSCDQVYRLCDRTTLEHGWLGTALCEERAAGRRRFWGDFETEPMRGKLSDMLGLRALAPVAEGAFGLSRCDLRNDEGKIVCRLEWVSVASGKRGDDELLHCCRVTPLLGYQAEAASVVDSLIRLGAAKSGAAPLEVLLGHANHRPQPYTLRPAFGLETETPAREAVGRIVRAMLEIALDNMPGIIDDLDTEFLHDYRICLRKMRSVLSLLKGVYPEEGTRRARDILGELARQTNRLRDLDVYLLERDEYLGLVPPALRPALAEMFKDFTADREKERRRIAKKLRAASTVQLVSQMQAYFQEKVVHEASPAADAPVGPLVFLRIHKRYRKIRKIAAGIGKDTPDQAVHRLRVECKKIRYLLEFFTELVPKKEGAEMQGSLRRLQNRLGEFNDASVQQASLLEYGHRNKSGTELSLALGGLVSILYQRQQQARGHIQQALDGFCGSATAATFKHAFKLPASAPAPDVK
jgi:CHAD domain-containing protein